MESHGAIQNIFGGKPGYFPQLRLAMQLFAALFALQATQQDPESLEVSCNIICD
jgi:hypothetical protein